MCSLEYPEQPDDRNEDLDDGWEVVEDGEWDDEDDEDEDDEWDDEDEDE